MISLPDRHALLSFADHDIPAGAREHVARHVELAIEGDLLDLTHVLVVQADDSEADIEQALGFNPLAHPIDGIHFRVPGFEPYWDYLADLGGWFELILPVGNSGFANVVLVEATAGPLADMCQRF